MGKKIPLTNIARSKVIGKALVKIGINYSKAKIQKFFISEPIANVEENTAKLIMDALGELKGVSVKIAQQIALALPFLPQSYLEHINKSFNLVPPINRALVRKIIKQEFNNYPENLFKSFETIPFGSASLGQVHKAMFDEKELAVKIQYPGIANTIKTDMKIVRFVLSRFAAGKNIDHIIEEINQRLYEEVDYRYEAENTIFFKKNIVHPYIVIPQVYEELSTSKVLTCSYIEGKSFSEFLTSSPSQELSNHYAQLLFDTFFTTLYRLKAIHADPNPGNFLFCSDQRLGIIDFGCVKYVDDDFLVPFNWLHLSLIDQCDDLTIAKQYAALNMIDTDEDENMIKFYNDVIKPLDRLYIEVLTHDIYDFGKEHYFSKRGFNAILQVQTQQASSIHKFNQEYLFLNRTLLGYYTMFEQLGAKIDTRSAKTMMLQYKGKEHE